MVKIEDPTNYLNKLFLYLIKPVEKVVIKKYENIIINFNAC